MNDVITEEPADADYDVIVVGAGLGGLYGVYRFTRQGLSVLGIEGAPDVGGVWYHNAYPGARVDTKSRYYSYYFDPDLYREWRWTETYAAQPEVLRYLRHVADRYDLRRHYRFNTWMTAGRWDPETTRYVVSTDTGHTVTTRFLVMATGQLSKPRRPPFAGLDDFTGEWAQTAQWRPVGIAGRRVGVIGTGSSGVQTVTAVAKVAAHTFVLQRTPHYCVPVNNGPADDAEHDRIAADVRGVWQQILATDSGAIRAPTVGAARDFTPRQRQEILEQRWRLGAADAILPFSDWLTDRRANDVVAEFVRTKTRERLDDPALAEKLVCDAYPIGVRRVCFDTGYYECFNQDNVSLVDVGGDPIDRITATGVRLGSGAHIELDTIIFALGFEAFTGALDAANIRNEYGRQPSDNWTRGPRTYLGLMTTGFPNLFIVTGPGSPSVLTNMNAANVQHLDFIGDLLGYMTERGHRRVEPTRAAEEAWTEHAAATARDLLSLRHDNYMVHINKDDGSRVFIPYAGGVKQYVQRCDDVVARGYAGFDFG